MKRLILAASFAAALPLMPATAAAQMRFPKSWEYKTVRCANEAIGSCNKDFPGVTENAVGIRGWCYAIRTSMCLVGL